MKSANIDFIKILKKAYSYIVKYKYLWLLGLLAGGGIGTGNSGYSASSSDYNQWKNWDSTKHLNNETINSLKVAGGKVLGADTGFSSAGWIIVAIFILALAIVAIYLSVTAHGAIISSVNKIDSGEDSNLSKAWRDGHKYFWKVFSFLIFSALLIVLPLIILGSVVLGFVLLHFNVTAIVFGILFFLVFIAYAIYLSLIIPYAERILILENLSPYQSLVAGYKYFNKNWKNIVLMYLLLIAVNLAASIALILGLGIIVMILVSIGLLFYIINVILVWIYAAIAGLAIIVLLAVAAGIIQSYYSTAVTLTYKEINSL